MPDSAYVCDQNPIRFVSEDQNRGVWTPSPGSAPETEASPAAVVPNAGAAPGAVVAPDAATGPLNPVNSAAPGAPPPPTNK